MDPSGSTRTAPAPHPRVSCLRTPGSATADSPNSRSAPAAPLPSTRMLAHRQPIQIPPILPAHATSLPRSDVWLRSSTPEHRFRRLGQFHANWCFICVRPFDRLPGSAPRVPFKHLHYKTCSATAARLASTAAMSARIIRRDGDGQRLHPMGHSRHLEAPLLRPVARRRCGRPDPGRPTADRPYRPKRAASDRACPCFRVVTSGEPAHVTPQGWRRMWRCRCRRRGSSK